VRRIRLIAARVSPGPLPAGRLSNERISRDVVVRDAE
jgi:hypothetical protein